MNQAMPEAQMSNRQRAENACKAVEFMGLYTPKTKPVLKRLLKSFDKNWEAIEADNYSVFVDALLSNDEEQGFIQKNSDPVDHDLIDEDSERNGGSFVDEPTVSRKRKLSQDKETPSASFSDRGISKEVVIQKHKSKENAHGISNATSLQFLSRNNEPLPSSPRASFKGKEIVIATDQMAMLQNEINPLSSRKQTGLKMLESNANQKSICFKKPKLEPVTSSGLNDYIENCTPGDENCDNIRYADSAHPIAIIYPAAPSSTTNGHTNIAKKCLVEDHSKQRATNPESQTLKTTDINAFKKDTRKSPHNDVTGLTKNSGTSGIPEDSSKNIEIASSSTGEVKLSFSLNGMSSEMCLPSLQSVFRTVEERCLKSYKIIQPNFSFGNLLTEMCETVKDLSESPDHEKLVNITPRLDCLKTNYGVRNTFCDASKTNATVSSSGDPLIMVTVPHHEPALGDIRPLHDVNDVAKGEERVRISVLNEVSSERYPPSFFYIPQNIVYQNGHVDFSLARIGDEDCCSDCFGDCLSASIPCPCARHTGGKYAYTSEGLVTKDFLDDCLSRFHNLETHSIYSYCKECPIEKSKNDIMPELCKGHPIRKFIKECWVKCGCSKQCGNRVVQRGITCNLQVFYTSENKGWGVRTLDELPRGTFVCEYIGEVLTNDELYERHQRRLKNGTIEKHTYPVLLDADWTSEFGLKDEEALCLDGTFYGNIARFINHRCSDPNLIEIPVEVETPDHHYYHLAFFTSRKVEAFEELTWDYHLDFDDHTHPVEAFRCWCGSKFCRDKSDNKKKKSRSNKS